MTEVEPIETGTEVGPGRPDGPVAACKRRSGERWFQAIPVTTGPALSGESARDIAVEVIRSLTLQPMPDGPGHHSLPSLAASVFAVLFKQLRAHIIGDHQGLAGCAGAYMPAALRSRGRTRGLQLRVACARSAFFHAMPNSFLYFCTRFRRRDSVDVFKDCHLAVAWQQHRQGWIVLAVCSLSRCWWNMSLFQGSSLITFSGIKHHQ